MPSPEPRLIVILGPTAVGKTEIALTLAERLGGEIISADSRLFYRGLDIGTAKPTPAELARVPHHLIDVAPPDEVWNLALFQQKVHQAILEINQRTRLPFLVGGTGQYIHAVLEGWQIPNTQPDPRLRRLLEEWGAQIGHLALHQRLSVLDPAAAQAIDPSNMRRTVRALEVILSSGRRFSAQQLRQTPLYHVLQVGLWRPRPELYARIDARIEAMLAAGFVEEVRGLLAQGYASDLPTLSAIGYAEVAQYLQGQISLDEAAMLMKRRTRVFVRRQANWFKENDPNIRWFRVADDTVDEVESAIREWLTTNTGEHNG